MKATNAVIGGEGNGGVIYPASHYGRDALVGIALFLSHLAHEGKKVSELRATYPPYFIAKNRVDLTPEIDVDAILAKVKEISGITCGGEAVEHILETYSYLIGEERKVIELANEAGDDATADLMTGYLKEQEKMVWMLVAFSTKSCAK